MYFVHAVKTYIMNILMENNVKLPSDRETVTYRMKERNSFIGRDQREMHNNVGEVHENLFFIFFIFNVNSSFSS